MKIIYPSIIFSQLLILSSCGNAVEEIKDPTTGMLLKKFEYYEDDNGQHIKDGEYKEWDKSGKLISDWHYADDSLDGKCVTVHEDGFTYTNNFRMGKMNGEQLITNPSGKIVAKRNSVDDLKQGKQFLYNDAGKAKVTQQFSKGVAVGEWTYFENGKSFKLHFTDGICQEFIGTWNENGDERSFMIFEKNGEFKFWSPNFRFSEPVLQMDGRFAMNDHRLQVSHQDKLFLNYDILSVNKNEIVLLSEDQDFSPAEKVVLVRKGT